MRDDFSTREPVPPGVIRFTSANTVILTLSKTGITANPAIPVDEAAQRLFEAFQKLWREKMLDA